VALALASLSAAPASRRVGRHGDRANRGPSWPTATSTLETTDEAADWLAKNGFDELYGARPLARVIQENIKKPLAHEILFGRLTKGGHVNVVLKDDKLAFEIEGQERERGAPVVETPEDIAAAEPVD
jgi:ATP-dependent Clp protease ATP-binding subunit ClpA